MPKWLEGLLVLRTVDLDVQESIDAGDQVVALIREREIGRASFSTGRASVSFGVVSSTTTRRGGRVTILRIVSRGLDRETYDTMRTMLDIDRKHPLGLIMHGVTERDGLVQVAQIWESPEYAQRFDEELLAPVIQAVGAPLDAEVTVYELEDLVTP